MTGRKVPTAGGLEMRTTWALAQALSPLSPRLGGAAASHLWFTPWRVGRTDGAIERQTRWLEGTRPFHVQTSVGELSGSEAGEGPTVLLVHGWADEAGTLGAFVEPLVDAGLRVVSVDMPAHGASPGRRTDALEWAEAIEAVARSAGGRVSLIAHSMGAIASAVAIQRGLEVERAVFIAPAVRMRKAFETFKNQARLNDAAAGALASAIERRFGADVWTRFETDHLVDGSGIAGLVIHDIDDRQVPSTESERLVASWEGATLLRTNGLGHNRILRDEAVVGRVVGFLREDEISGVRERELVATS